MDKLEQDAAETRVKLDNLCDKIAGLTKALYGVCGLLATTIVGVLTYGIQIGAYSSLDNAKKACKAGDTVYDANGKAVYTAASGTAATYAKGTKITLTNATLYASSTASSGTKKSGTYYNL